MKPNRLLRDFQPLKSLKNCDIRIYEIIHLKLIVENLARKSNRKKEVQTTVHDNLRRLLMINQILLYSGSVFIAFWGIAHLFPTKSIVSGFGEISLDNKRIITMEWIIEGIALIFIGSINAIVTAIDYTSSISLVIYLSSVVVLFVLAFVRFSRDLRSVFSHSNYVL